MTFSVVYGISVCSPPDYHQTSVCLSNADSVYRFWLSARVLSQSGFYVALTDFSLTLCRLNVMAALYIFEPCHLLPYANFAFLEVVCYSTESLSMQLAINYALGLRSWYDEYFSSSLRFLFPQ